MPTNGKILGVCGGMAQQAETQIFSNGIESLARYLVQNQMQMLYGGVKTGLVGLLAKFVSACGGFIEGAIVNEEKKDAYEKLQKTIYFDQFSDRKAYLFEKSDLLLFLPGGLGTFDEVFTLLIENKIGFRHKRLVLWNSENFWSPIFELLENAKKFKLLEKKDTDCVMISDNVEIIGQWLHAN